MALLVLRRFVADQPGNLGRGRLYAAKMTQTAATNGGSFAVRPPRSVAQRPSAARRHHQR